MVYDAEVMIQDVNPCSAKTFKEFWFYGGAIGTKKKPLYFAPYFVPTIGVTHISRVLHTKSVKASEGPEAIDVGTAEQRERWEKGWAAHKECFNLTGNDEIPIYLLEEPIEFRTKPLTKNDFNSTDPSKKMPPAIPPGFSLRFDQLFRADSILRAKDQNSG